MKCVIIQPSYIPWRGYFDLLQRADVAVFYDDVQYDKHGWRNRNRIKTPAGTKWLTIPVRSKGNVSRHIPINEIRFSEPGWPERHRSTVERAYSRAPFFDRALLDQLYGGVPDKLADFTIATTMLIARRLGITTTRFIRSSELEAAGSSTVRLIAILRQLGADHYISGPSARAYIDPARFEEAGIRLEYIEYDYPEYPQLYPPFDGLVSILDLLFMTGADAPRFIWSRE